MPTKPHHSLAQGPRSAPAPSGAAADNQDVDGMDKIAELARRWLGCKAAVVKIFDPDRPRFRAVPTGADEHPQELELCASAVLHDGQWTIGGATVDPGDLTNPLAANDLGLRFYAGIPLRTSSGRTVGVLAAVDFEPRELSEDELETLNLLAAVAAELADARK